MSKHRQQSDLTGQGPWLFRRDADLSPGETWLLALDTLTYNGQARYFKPRLPLDDALVTNKDTANSVEVEYNGLFDSVVQPNSSRGFDRAGITSIAVTNIGTTAIAADDVLVEASKEAYGVDEHARRERSQSSLSRVVEHVTGLRL